MITKKSLLLNSTENLAETNINADTRNADLNYLKEKEFHELQKRFFGLEDSIAQYFDQILNTSIKEVLLIIFPFLKLFSDRKQNPKRKRVHFRR